MSHSGTPTIAVKRKVDDDILVGRLPSSLGALRTASTSLECTRLNCELVAASLSLLLVVDMLREVSGTVK